MAFLKFIFFLQLYLIIRLGDFVYLVLVIVFSPIAFLLNWFFKIVRRKKKVKPIHDRVDEVKYRKDIGTIGSINNKITSFIKSFLENLHEFILRILRTVIVFVQVVFGETMNFIFFTFSVILLPIRILSKIFKRKKNPKRGRTHKADKNKVGFYYKLKYIWIGIFFSFLIFVIPIIIFFFMQSLPKLSDLSYKNIPKSTKILDRNGALLYEIYINQNRTIVPLSKIPASLKNATIAIEDKDFYNHIGFDLRAMGRAFYVNFKNKKLQGGSTITQQLIKSALLTPETTFVRKLKEIILAFMAERKYSKNEILELYFNLIPYGGTAWGIEAASNTYFGKDVSSLTLAESAYLAGLPQAPGEYNPFAGDLRRGKNRQKEVLDAMTNEKYITSEQAKNAFSQELNFIKKEIPIKAPHFVMYVKDLLVKKYGLYNVEMGGLLVKTTLDLQKQTEVENIVSSEVEKSRYLGVGNGASLVVNPKNGDILAMVGSKDYFDTTNDGNVNVTTSLRQPGSSIKIVPYTLALTKGFTEATILDDSPLTISNPYGPSYSPVNYDGRFHGKIPLRIAFANSFNIPAVKVAQKLGVREIVEFGNKMGISSWKDSSDYGFSIALGAGEVSMVELVTAYGVIANGGEKVDIDPILEVKNADDKKIYEKIIKRESIIDEGIAFIVSDILADNKARSIAFGLNTPLIIPNKRVSVKTGTTDNKRDNWTVGFTPDVVVATWVGNNDNTPLSQALASGITGAAPMWHQIMLKMLNTEPNLSKSVPTNLIQMKCFGYNAYFVKGTEVNQCKGGYGVSLSPSISPSPILINNKENIRNNRYFPF